MWCGKTIATCAKRAEQMTEINEIWLVTSRPWKKENIEKIIF